MVILAALQHKTIYKFDAPVNIGPHLIRLRPAPHTRMPIKAYALSVGPAPNFLNWQQDAFGNWVARCVFPERARELVIEADLVFEHAVFNPFDFFVEDYATQFPFRYETGLRSDLGTYLKSAKPGALADAYLAVQVKAGPTVQLLVDLNASLARDIAYRVRLEPGVQTAEQTLKLREGSCRDSALLLVHLARHLGFAARFVSGYLVQLAPDPGGEVSRGEDSCDLHAWAEVYLPGAGWIGFDPTSGLLAGEGHIPLAAAPSPAAAAPVSGSVEHPASEFVVEMSVTRLAEAPRVSAPVPDDAWAALASLGDAVEADLVSDDVRLTMGGEPTFVSIADYQEPEWNIEADGATKRPKADELLDALRVRHAPLGLIHFGQGKWYPGEPLPRWALSLFWRPDGEAIVEDAALFAREGAEGDAGPDTARALATAIASRLGIDPLLLLQAFEDGEAETVAAYVLPVRRLQTRGGDQWISEAWTTERDRFCLAPGQSPAGHRLPLNALPAVAPDKYPYIVERDPSEPREALPSRDVIAEPYRAVRPLASQTSNEIVRTALVVEPRGGVLHVFMPPLATAEDYLDLLAAVEHSARALQTSLRIEGYEPPRDPRLKVIKVTPDPGVLEINVQPAESWRECVEATIALYEDAHACGLRAEKFMIDGRHTGTGGGNHIVVGGATPQDSPFLRRPDLLKSLLIYWQRHPSLSYLFSGLFIGPSSQAPRIDEARHDALYELEIALESIAAPKRDEAPPPWLIDRLLRNLLADATGNTHRTEICIDKLFSPDGPMGRLGLVEFRGFEMPPHARMSLAQQLLMRALIALFWKEPQNGALMRWGAALGDRFMLSQFVWEDFEDVLADLARAGYGFDPAWFDAQREFRFPYYGAVNCGGVDVELRYALEPWHVMGEESASGGVVRYVDASLERLEVRVRGARSPRHLVLCNGRVIPLAATREAGLQVGGVRFKAWKQPSGLHPNLPVDAPLTFDVFDTWSKRSIGGFVYHVAHPAGRSYETFPVNANEAQARRLARVVSAGHSSGVRDVPVREHNPEFAMTLDLRRKAPVGET